MTLTYQNTDYKTLEILHAPGCPCAGCANRDDTVNAEPDTSTPVSAAGEIFTTQEAAFFLTNTFWGGQERRYDVQPGDTLTYDISSLEENGQTLAQTALDTWSHYTGILFEPTTTTAPTRTTYTENTNQDAPTTTSTPYSMAVGDVFYGDLDSVGDRDWIRLRIEGDVTIQLSGDGSQGSPLADPYLRLYNAQGAEVASNDDGGTGLNSSLTFNGNGQTYYIEAGSFADAYMGAYEIRVLEGEVSTPDIVFSDDQQGAYASSQVFLNTIISTSININSNWAGGSDRLDGYHYQTYLHEIGHALGLGHAGDYNNIGTYGTDNAYANDSWQLSPMSYFSQNENTAIDASFAYTLTPMLADIYAIHQLYGTPDTNTGNTSYGNGANLLGTLGDPFSYANTTTYTIFDTDGTDTLNFSDTTATQTIRMAENTYSDVYGLTGVVGIAIGSEIEYALGGNGIDTVYGNDLTNRIATNAGNDTLYGYAGNDRLFGGSGTDVLFGGDDRDEMRGEADDDILYGGTQRDRMYGHQGQDTLYGETGDDTLFGGVWSDTLYGGSEDDSLHGGQSNDFLWGEEGDDLLYGDGGRDNLVGGVGKDILRGGDDNDTMYGGGWADELYGGSGNDRLKGWSGDDWMEGGAGSDTLYGGNGDDTFLLGFGDRAWGDWGADTFTFVAQTTGLIRIYDFTQEDTIDLSDVTILDTLIQSTLTTYLLDTDNNGTQDVTLEVNEAASFNHRERCRGYSAEDIKIIKKLLRQHKSEPP